MLKNKKVLVTGGAGTVGCNIVKKLVDRDAEVTVVDNLSAYPFDYLKDYGVGDISAVNFVKGDITDKNLIDNLCYNLLLFVFYFDFFQQIYKISYLLMI